VRPPGEAGFTLIEVLMATLLMTVILAALATVTAQWLPNWNRGMGARAARRAAVDRPGARAWQTWSVAEMISDERGQQEAVVRGIGIIGNDRSGQPSVPTHARASKIIRLIEKADDQGLALVRERASFNPMAVGRADPLLPTRSC